MTKIAKLAGRIKLAEMGQMAKMVKTANRVE